MNDLDLDRWAAEVLMGWEQDEIGWWVKPDPENKEHPWVSALPVEARYDAENYGEFDCNVQQPWHPTSPDAPAWQIQMCIEKVALKGFAIGIAHFKLGGYWRAYLQAKYDTKHYGDGNSIGGAILTAAKVALEKVDE